MKLIEHPLSVGKRLSELRPFGYGDVIRTTLATPNGVYMRTDEGDKWINLATGGITRECYFQDTPIWVRVTKLEVT